MGTAFTPELLSQIQSKKVPNINNKIRNENIYYKKRKRPKFKEIITEIYSPFYKKAQSEITKIEETKNEIIINNNKEELNLNKIFFQRHKSFDGSYNYFNNLDIINYDKKILEEKNEILSEKDNDSIISDYADISNDMISFNKNKKKEGNNNTKDESWKKIRDGYYNKLITKSVWNPLKKEKILNNIFFFDWDDTLLCTSYLQPTGAFVEMEINKRDKEVISNLDSLVSKLLLKAMNLGAVFLVTNGAPGWVELSSKKFYPKTSNILKKIRVVSARGICERKLPGDMRQWKKVAFKYALDSMRGINKNIVTNIICLGDSIIEMEASLYIKEFFPNAYLKTIKFKENPTHTELEKELKIISAQLDSIMNNNDKNLSIKVTRKKND